MSRVFVFTGHMIDKVGRTPPRFPLSAESAVRDQIARMLEKAEMPDGFASAACGGDILFHESIQRHGGRSHVVLPCPEHEFRAACVDPFPGGWGDRFEKIIETATLEVLSEQCANDNSIASECCNRVVFGLADLWAKEKNLPLTVLALWDTKPGDAIGGTASMVKLCEDRGCEIRQIGNVLPCTPSSSTVPFDTSSGTRLPGAEEDPPQQIAGALFADVVGFGSLSERVLPGFAKHYLGGVHKLVLEYGEEILTQNTWGDGLYLAFRSIRSAGQFALDLRDFVNETNWVSLGFPNELLVRIGLHGGPVYRIHDPIIGGANYIGRHIKLAARIEPLAVGGGHPYCTLAFAALAASEGVNEFSCHSQQKMRLPKEAGETDILEVHRKA